MSDDRKVAVIGMPTSASASPPARRRHPRRSGSAPRAASRRRSRGSDHGDREICAGAPTASDRLPRTRQGRRVRRRTPPRGSAKGPTPKRSTLVLGGDCTVGIGTVAGHVATRRASASSTSTSTPTSISHDRSPTARSTGWGWPTCSARRAPSGAGRGRPEDADARARQVSSSAGAPSRPPRTRARRSSAWDSRGSPGTKCAGTPRGRRHRRSEPRDRALRPHTVHFDVDVVDFTDPVL